MEQMCTCREGAAVGQVHGDVAAQQDEDLLGVRVAPAEQRLAFIEDPQLALPQHLQHKQKALALRPCSAIPISWLLPSRAVASADSS